MDRSRRIISLALLVALLAGGMAAPVLHAFQHGHDERHVHDVGADHHEGADWLVEEHFEEVDCSLFATTFSGLELDGPELRPSEGARSFSRTAAERPPSSHFSHVLIRGPPGQV